MRLKICYTNCSSCLLKFIIRSKRESSFSLALSLSPLGGHIGFSSSFPLLICCFPLHNLWRLIMFRQTTNGTRKLAARDDFCWVPPYPSSLIPPPASLLSLLPCLPLTPCDVCATRQSLFLFSVFPSRIAPFIFAFYWKWGLRRGAGGIFRVGQGDY